MANNENKEPDFYPFRLKDHGWVLKKGVPIETIGDAFLEIVYQLVTKDFKKGSIAEAMYNDAIEMMKAKSDKARNAANTRWGNNAENTGQKVKPISVGRCPSSKEEFRQFVADNDLHIGFAEEWLEIHEKRDWADEKGNPLKNWKGAVTNYCKSKEKKQNEH